MDTSNIHRTGRNFCSLAKRASNSNFLMQEFRILHKFSPIFYNCLRHLTLTAVTTAQQANRLACLAFYDSPHLRADMARNQTRLLLALLFLCILYGQTCAKKTYYDTLGISRSATEEQVKRTYRKLALKYHPDKNSGDQDATKRFAEINNAYEVLADKEKRALYDQFGEEGLRRNQNAQQQGNVGSDIFSQFFGGTGFRFEFSQAGGAAAQESETSPTGHDVVVELHASLEDCYMGSSRKVWREKNVVQPAAGTRQCNCKNQMRTKQMGPGMFQQYTEQVCEQCPNVRFSRAGEWITVDIARGMSEGQEVVFYGDGEPVLDGDSGDLKFVLRTLPHHRFQRHGQNLATSVTISLLDALVGFRKEIEHLDGHAVVVGSDGVTRPSETRRFQGHGMPVLDSSITGDLLVTFDVTFPAFLSDSQKTAFVEALKS